MSATTALIVFLAAIVLAVLIGTKLKCNIGVIGITFAFLIGTILIKNLSQKSSVISRLLSYLS